jgi:hypothetical protein
MMRSSEYGRCRKSTHASANHCDLPSQVRAPFVLLCSQSAIVGQRRRRYHFDQLERDCPAFTPGVTPAFEFGISCVPFVQPWLNMCREYLRENPDGSKSDKVSRKK